MYKFLELVYHDGRDIRIFLQEKLLEGKMLVISLIGRLSWIN